MVSDKKIRVAKLGIFKGHLDSEGQTCKAVNCNVSATHQVLAARINGFNMLCMPVSTMRCVQGENM